MHRPQNIVFYTLDDLGLSRAQVEAHIKGRPTDPDDGSPCLGTQLGQYAADSVPYDCWPVVIGKDATDQDREGIHRNIARAAWSELGMQPGGEKYELPDSALLSLRSDSPYRVDRVMRVQRKALEILTIATSAQFLFQKLPAPMAPPAEQAPFGVRPQRMIVLRTLIQEAMSHVPLRRMWASRMVDYLNEGPFHSRRWRPLGLEWFGNTAVLGTVGACSPKAARQPDPGTHQGFLISITESMWHVVEAPDRARFQYVLKRTDPIPVPQEETFKFLGLAGS